MLELAGFSGRTVLTTDAGQPLYRDLLGRPAIHSAAHRQDRNPL
jgi:hypothetical protein